MGSDKRLAGNLALLRRHHHRMKTYDGWTLARTGHTDADPGWTFTPMPAFGEEPDLGLDRSAPDRDAAVGARRPAPGANLEQDPDPHPT